MEEIIICTVEEYINAICGIKHRLSCKRQMHKNMKFFYRGEAADFKELKPGISRGDHNLIPVERELIGEFCRLKPTEFKGLDNDFELIAKMQHYGLKTRLLDVTRNPLVALYFAVMPPTEEDGEIFIFPYENIYSSEDFITVFFSSFYKRSVFNDSHLTLYNLVSEIKKGIRARGEEYESLLKSNIKKDVKKIMKNNNFPICVLPTIYSEREVRQQGAFLLFPNKLNYKSNFLDFFDIKGKRLCFESEVLDFKPYAREVIDKRIIIDKNSKEKILKELNEFSVSRDFIFPEIEYTAREINDKFCN